jgi:hypothetical protein
VADLTQVPGGGDPPGPGGREDAARGPGAAAGAGAGAGAGGVTRGAAIPAAGDSAVAGTLSPALGGADPDDPLGAVQEWGNLAPMIGFLAVAGALLSLAAANDWTWAFVVGFVMVAVWVLSLLARGHPSRWTAR